MGRLGEGAGRPRLELGLGRLAREARPRRSLGLVNASGLERFDAKQGRQQARLGLRRQLGIEDGSGAKVVANGRGDPPDLTRGDESNRTTTAQLL